MSRLKGIAAQSGSTVVGASLDKKRCYDIGNLVHPKMTLTEGDCVPAGPSAEVEFWRQRAAMLMGLSEQLNLPRIRMMVDAVELGSSDQNLLSSFRTQHQDVKWVGSRKAAFSKQINMDDECWDESACNSRREHLHQAVHARPNRFQPLISRAEH